MNNLLEDQISMVIKTDLMLDTNVAQTISVPLVGTSAALVKSKLATLLGKAGEAGLDITGNSEQKQDKRNALTQTAIIISRALAIHGYATEDKELVRKYDLSISELNQMRDGNFYVQCLHTKDEAALLAASLLPYNITPLILTQLNTDLAAYYAVVQKPRSEYSIQNNLKDEINVLLGEIYTIFNTQLDLAMSLFQFSNPSLYNLYQSARSIDNTGSITTPDYQGDVPGGSILIVASIPYLSARSFRLKNTGTIPLIMSLSNDPNLVQGNFAMVAPGEESNVLMSSELNIDNTADNLIVQNQTPVLGSYKIYITE